MNDEVPTLLEYAPSPDEEVNRLKKLAEERTAQMEVLLNDPIITQLCEMTKRFDKVLKDYTSARDSAKKLSTQIQSAKKKSVAPILEEPTEDGFYILTSSDFWQNNLQTTKKLFLKAFGSWFDLEDGGNSLHLGMDYGKPVTFQHFMNIDGDTIEVSLVKVTDTTTFPAQLLKNSDEETDDLSASETDSEISEDEE